MGHTLRKDSGFKVVGGKLVKGEPLEHRMQTQVVEWADLQGRAVPALACLYAVPNAAVRNKGQAGWMIDEGMRTGVPDLVLPVARGGFHALYIEMKRKPNGISANQQKWIDRLRAQGNRVEVCWSADEAILLLRTYLGIK
jgi:hypothetical protein